ncbi:hypothetical protein [Gracilibacillus xinjiangensis]|uniref:DUF3887 domain-containing protein n=1 Tax=Gracilibacillus xinjiangensis TaxID=1193282 RepID=A0ABV8WQS0_9BACI
MFQQSAAAFQKIARESITILEKFTEPEFSQSLMTAAQAGNQKEVDRLIKSIGTSTPVEVKYTPTGLLLTIYADAQGTQCCTLSMFLRWGN